MVKISRARFERQELVQTDKQQKPDISRARVTLTTRAFPLENAYSKRVSKNATSMYSGCPKTPIKFFPYGISVAIFPPTLESRIAKRGVGI